MACIVRFLRQLHFMACLNWLLLRVGSGQVAGARAKAPDSGEQPWASAARAPGAEQVEHMSSGASESGDVEDTPRLQSHAVDLFSPGSNMTGATLSRNSRNLVLQRLCRV